MKIDLDEKTFKSILDVLYRCYESTLAMRLARAWEEGSQWPEGRYTIVSEATNDRTLDWREAAMLE